MDWCRRQWIPELRRGGVILLLVAALSGWSFGRAFAVAVDVFTVDDEIRLDVTCGQLIDEDLQKALQSGLPARVELRAELWRRRTTFFDAFVLDTRTQLRVVFDVIDEKFDVVDDFDQVLVRGGGLDDVEHIIGMFRDLPLCDADELDSDESYYVTVRLRVEPLSVEEMRDLEQWLRGGISGEAEDGRLERVPGQLLGVLKGRIGLGDRQHDGRSRRFRVGGLEER